jgi:hypothetical protein
MATSFRTPINFIERAAGVWREGRYYPETVGTIKSISVTIQEPGERDRNAIDALPGGRRAGRYIKIYTDVKLNTVSQEPGGSPGDLVLYDQKQFIVLGESNFTYLRRTIPTNDVSHYRYYAAEVIEQQRDRTERLP